MSSTVSISVIYLNTFSAFNNITSFAIIIDIALDAYTPRLGLNGKMRTLTSFSREKGCKEKRS